MYIDSIVVIMNMLLGFCLVLSLFGVTYGNLRNDQQDARRTDAVRVLQQRPPLPDFAGQPQIQPARIRRDEQRIPHPDVLNRDVPIKDTQERLQARSSRTSTIRNDGRRTDTTRLSQTRPPLPGFARQPQIQPARVRRDEQRIPHPIVLNGDVFRRDTRQERLQTMSSRTEKPNDDRRTDASRLSQTRLPLSGFARQRQIQPARICRDEQRIPHPIVLNGDVSRKDTRQERLQTRSSRTSEKPGSNTVMSPNIDDSKNVPNEETEMNGPISPTRRHHVNEFQVAV